MLAAATIDLLAGIYWALGASLVAGAFYLFRRGFASAVKEEIRPLVQEVHEHAELDTRRFEAQAQARVEDQAEAKKDRRRIHERLDEIRAATTGTQTLAQDLGRFMEESRRDRDAIRLDLLAMKAFRDTERERIWHALTLLGADRPDETP